MFGIVAHFKPIKGFHSIKRLSTKCTWGKSLNIIIDQLFVLTPVL
jgi:hypothetical protein